MDFLESEEIGLLRDTLRKYLAKEVPAAKAEQWDREDRIPAEELRKLGELGMCGLCIPEEYGGTGFNVMAMTAAVEEISRHSIGLGSYFFMCAGYGGLNIAESGSAAQKERLLPLLAAGEIAFSYGLSEPGIGADLGNVATRATREGDRIIINGAKRWTSAASMNQYIYSLVRTGPESDRRRNLSFILIPTDAPGVTVTDLAAMGHNGTPLADVTFDNVELSIDDVVGGEAGWNNGWNVLAGPALEAEKLAPASLALGTAEAAMAEAWEYSQNRVQGGKRICGHQTIRHALVEAKTQLQACRLMLQHAAWLVETRRPSAVATSMAKLFVAERCREVVLSCQQVMGAYGYANGFQMQRYVRDIIAVPIYGGSSTVQKNNIANLLRLPRE